ncbi:MAG TPA: 7-cyano-7-deazaguanine synthase QueC [Dehalococcoidia bacterium]|jgi:7-cyano-7-deazaguanine synthase|nr:7-cyano-7-deazaguanine synthase QueC [SAR202 cluster bacterium]HIN37146.1 7-cyano-7-deazaguanine synthase QueC [Dehalococcoidia bacterium]|tara:strand:+ start:4851 stop:5582 length:732 start_codon:yes stop_codon:yes gene_type:complete
MPSYGVSLLSGGLDSTTVTALAKGKTDHLTALTFHYGQSHSKEVNCAAEVARSLGVTQELLDISFLGKVAWYSALTNPEQFPMPEDREASRMGNSIPITYVPLRNTIFLSLAAASLESQVLYAIEIEHVLPEDVQAYIYMAPNAIDYSGYPDCRPEFFQKMGESLGYGSKLWTEYHVPLQIEIPIIEMSKADIVRLAMELEAPLELTWSCYQGGEIPCGRCDSCILRASGFRAAGYPDPAVPD